MTFIINIFGSAWQLLLASSIYILFGLLVSGLLKVFLDPNMVVRHLGHGRFASVFKAALLGIPIPLCSCGVLPAALSFKKQGASNGATTAFYDFYAGIRCGFHCHQLCPAGSCHDHCPAGRRFLHGGCGRGLRKSLWLSIR